MQRDSNEVLSLNKESVFHSCFVKNARKVISVMRKNIAVEVLPEKRHQERSVNYDSRYRLIPLLVNLEKGVGGVRRFNAFTENAFDEVLI